MVWNSNKRSVAIDLARPEGRQVLLDMLPQYDVFVENYGPGVMEKLQLDYASMRAVKPDIIYARIKGFGTSGPWADYKCYDMVAQSAAGAFSITGEPDGPPLRPGPTTGDAGTGIQMALAITAAYVQKLNTGKGQEIELSMQEAMTYYLRTATSGGNYGERAARRTGNGITPNMTLYRCKGDGANDYVYVMAVTPRMWEDLCKAIDREDLLTDPRYAGPTPAAISIGKNCAGKWKRGRCSATNTRRCACWRKAACQPVPCWIPATCTPIRTCRNAASCMS